MSVYLLYRTRRRFPKEAPIFLSPLLLQPHGHCRGGVENRGRVSDFPVGWDPGVHLPRISLLDTGDGDGDGDGGFREGGILGAKRSVFV
jgi:hypothetical protein